MQPLAFSMLRIWVLSYALSQMYTQSRTVGAHTSSYLQAMCMAVMPTCQGRRAAGEHGGGGGAVNSLPCQSKAEQQQCGKWRGGA